MIQNIPLYSNKNKEPFTSAISLLNRLQDRFLYPNIEELSITQLHEKRTISVDFDSVLSKFKKYVSNKKHPYALYLIEFGLSPKRVLINGYEGLVCLGGITNRFYPFATAYYIFKASAIMTFNPQCLDDACLLSASANDLNADICDLCLSRLHPEEKDFLNTTTNWFKKLFSKIKNQDINDRELSRIFEVPRALLYDFAFDCQDSVCFIKNDFSKDDVKIAVVQIEVRFDDELKKEFEDAGLYKRWSTNGINQINKICNILKVLRDSESPDIVIFPELSVPPGFLSQNLMNTPFATTLCVNIHETPPLC